MDEGIALLLAGRDTGVRLPVGDVRNISDTLVGVENVTAGSGNDTLVDSIDNNTLIGNAGNDTIDIGHGGNDVADGGVGNDRHRPHAGHHQEGREEPDRAQVGPEVA